MNERLAAALRGMGPLGAAVFLAILAFSIFAPPADLHTILGVGLILLWAKVSRTPLRDIGLVRPPSWRDLGIGVLLGLLDKLLMKSVVLPLMGAPAVNARFQHVVWDVKRIVVVLVLAIVSAGICEEIVYRGYLFDRLGKWFGDSSAARAAIVVLAAILFGVIHSFQGVFGAVNAGLGGLIAGVIYYANGKRLPMIMAMHATFDVAGFLLIVFGLEERAAHLFFR
jgi:membrane protease YdiL (CAAX protease family)